MIQTITKNENGGETVENIFTSLQDLEVAEIPDINKEQAERRIFNQDRPNWFGPKGFNTFSDVQKAVNKGWPDGVKKARKLGKDIEVPPVKSIRRRRIRGDRGDTLDIHAVNSGAFDKAWTRRGKRETSAPPQLTMAVNLTANYTIKATALYWRGAAALKLAEMLEDSGYSLEIWAFDSTSKAFGENSSNKNRNAYLLKESGQQIFANSLISTIGLAGFFRGYGFKAINLINAKTCINYGIPENVKPSNLENADIDGLEMVSDKFSAENWIKQQIEKLGM